MEKYFKILQNFTLPLPESTVNYKSNRFFILKGKKYYLHILIGVLIKECF